MWRRRLRRRRLTMGTSGTFLGQIATILATTLAIFLGGALVLTIVVVALWPRGGRYGINLRKVFCPKCREPMPRIRRPKNERQRLWGGWTCPKCGCEMDKYGVDIDDEEAAV